MELSLYHYFLLFFGAILSGLVDSIAGGGGIITIPLLLSVGLPPHAAIATNKLQASFGTFTAMMRYRHSRLFTFRTLIPGILLTAAGAAGGAYLIQQINADALAQVIPFILLALLIYTAASPQLGLSDTQAKMAEFPIFLIFGLAIGFYDGFFGPGTGSFWTMGLVILAGYNLKRATAVTKVMNFTSNCVSLIIFLLGGKVIIAIGLLMGAGQLLGAWSGSHLVITRGTKFVKIFFMIVVSITIIDLMIKQFA
ncbi:MAG: TSUP family transporter [Spirochaetales bacterium]|jgi:uncharacterized membrane protein YfcA|nr:TSUP family transporter [Spirochaetales bacterium]